MNSFNSYKFLGIVPISLWLSISWQFDKHAIHDGFVNSFSFDHVGRKVTLLSMSPKEIIEDQKKLREKIQRERKIEGESDKKKVETENKVERKMSEKEEKNKEIKKQEKSEQKSGNDECSLVKRKESLLLERRLLMVRKPCDLNVPNISCLSFHDLGTPQGMQKSLLELGKMFPMEEAHGLSPFKGLEIGKQDFFLVPTNPLLVGDKTFCRNFEETPPKNELKPYSSSIALVPREELFIKEQWARQFGEDIKLPRRFGFDMNTNFQTPYPSFKCDIDVQMYHNLFYESKLKIACALSELDASCAWHWWLFVRDSSLLPWKIHDNIHAYLNFELYIPICLKDDLHMLDVRKEHVLLLYDLKLSKACVILCLKNQFDLGRWRPQGILIPYHFYFPPSLHACLHFESHAPFTFLDWHPKFGYIMHHLVSTYIMWHIICGGDLFIWVYDPGINKGATKAWISLSHVLWDGFIYSSLVGSLSNTFVGDDALNLWANSSQEGGYDGGPSWTPHTLDEGPSMEARRVTRSMTKKLQVDLEDQTLTIFSAWNPPPLEPPLACNLLCIELGK